MDRSIHELHDLGSQLFEEGKYSEAEPILRDVIGGNPKYADVHNKLGVISFLKGDFKQAAGYFKKALELNPDAECLYEKLIKTIDQKDGEWELDDFADSVTWAMKKQEQDNPSIRQVHAKLTPEWEKAMELTLNILQADEDVAKNKIEELVQMGDIATRVLIEMMLDFKKSAEKE